MGEIQKKANFDQYADLLWGKHEIPPAPQSVPSGGAYGAGTRHSQVRLILVVDRSYSMYRHRHRMRDGLAQFLDTVDQSIPYLVPLIQFDNEITQLATAEPLAALIARAAVQAYEPRGDTALWDALAATFAQEACRTEPVLCLIASDGDDNVSRHTLAEITPLVSKRADWGNWTFLWLNMSGFPNASAHGLGIECLDFSREDAPRVLAGIGSRLGNAVKRMRLEGSRRLDARALLGHGEKR